MACAVAYPSAYARPGDGYEHYEGPDFYYDRPSSYGRSLPVYYKAPIGGGKMQVWCLQTRQDWAVRLDELLLKAY